MFYIKRQRIVRLKEPDLNAITSVVPSGVVAFLTIKSRLPIVDRGISQIPTNHIISLKTVLRHHFRKRRPESNWGASHNSLTR